MFSTCKDLFKGRTCPSIAADKFCRLLYCPFDHPERVKRDADQEEVSDRVKRRRLTRDEVDVLEEPDQVQKKEEEEKNVVSNLQPEIPSIASSTAVSEVVTIQNDEQKHITGHKVIQKPPQNVTKAPSALPTSSNTPPPPPPPPQKHIPPSTTSKPPPAPPKPAQIATKPPPSASSTLKSALSTPAPSASRDSKPQSAISAVKSVSRDPTSSRDPSASSDAPHLHPTNIFPCPATLPQRITYLKAIHSALVQHRKLKVPKKAAILEELACAKKSAGSYMVYTNDVRVLVKSIKDGTWRGGGKGSTEKPASNDMSSILTQLNVLAAKIKPILRKNGYPISPTASKSSLPANIGIQHCDRCNKVFDVPKVDNYGSCKYHWARPRMGGNSTSPEKFYPCCNQPVGASEGCEEAPRHVYKLHELDDLAFVIPFRRVPKGEARDQNEKPGSRELKQAVGSGRRTVFNGPAVASREPDVTLENMSRDSGKSRDKESRDTPSLVCAMDCEMLYTTLGMELCRVTCVDFFGKKTLDRVVRPTGRILDYNTRFSGISDINDSIITETGQPGPSVSFSEAQKLVFGLVDSGTILVGHGLENDLNAMRLIHEKVIDTSILYPEFNPKYKTALKTLALKYLKRTIQTGEHDSMEDALAALDVVKAHLKK